MASIMQGTSPPDVPPTTYCPSRAACRCSFMCPTLSPLYDCHRSMHFSCIFRTQHPRPLARNSEISSEQVDLLNFIALWRTINNIQVQRSYCRLITSSESYCPLPRFSCRRSAFFEIIMQAVNASLASGSTSAASPRLPPRPLRTHAASSSLSPFAPLASAHPRLRFTAPSLSPVVSHESASLNAPAALPPSTVSTGAPVNNAAKASSSPSPAVNPNHVPWVPLRLRTDELWKLWHRSKHS